MPVLANKWVQFKHKHNKREFHSCYHANHPLRAVQGTWWTALNMSNKIEIKRKNTEIFVINKVYLLYNRLPLVYHQYNVQMDIIYNRFVQLIENNGETLYNHYNVFPCLWIMKTNSRNIQHVNIEEYADEIRVMCTQKWTLRKYVSIRRSWSTFLQRW